MMQFLPLLLLAGVIIILVLIIQKRDKHNKKIEMEYSQAITFEEKMLLYQRESNNRLKNIDNTLDWFFWIMIISFVLTFLYYLMAELSRY